MGTFKLTDTVGDVVARRPVLSRMFEQANIDYCCGGGRTLEEACRERGIDPPAFLAALEHTAAPVGTGQEIDVLTMSLTDLADHVERTHHAYLRSELPQLDRMTEKVASVHGEKDSRLRGVRDVFVALSEEFFSHMMKEERILFPMIRELDASEDAPAFHCGTLAGPIRRMEMEHEEVGSALERLRELTGGFAPPDWACSTYHAMLDGLTRLEHDTHQHIHKENNVLFPRALEMEDRKRAALDRTVS